MTRAIADLPGPRGLPLLGNALQVRLSRVHLDFERWAARYGRFFRVRLGPRLLLAVTDHEVIQQIMRERPDRFRRSARLLEVGTELGATPGLFTAEGEQWRRQRRLVMAGLAPGHIRAYFPMLTTVALRLRGRWQQAAQAGTSIDLQSDLKRYTLDAIASLAFGSDVNSLESDDNTLQRHVDTLLAGIFRRAMSPLPYWHYLKTPADRRLEASNAAIGEAIERFIAQARERMQADPGLRTAPGNLLEAMLAAADADEAGHFNDADVAANVSTLLFAGEDTTANTLAWLIYLLHRHPAALRRVQDEVLHHAPEPAAFSLEQMASLDYLEACINEAMRLVPVAPFLTFEAIDDTTIEDIAVPAGSVIWCLLRHDSLLETHFADAASFDPGRWLAASATPVGNKRIAMPFGSGPRICPGRYLALLEIKLAMATLLGSFDIAAVDTPDGGDAREVMTFTMNPLGLRMRLRARR